MKSRRRATRDLPREFKLQSVLDFGLDLAPQRMTWGWDEEDPRVSPAARSAWPASIASLRQPAGPAPTASRSRVPLSSRRGHSLFARPCTVSRLAVLILLSPGAGRESGPRPGGNLARGREGI